MCSHSLTNNLQISLVLKLMFPLEGIRHHTYLLWETLQTRWIQGQQRFFCVFFLVYVHATCYVMGCVLSSFFYFSPRQEMNIKNILLQKQKGNKTLKMFLIKCFMFTLSCCLIPSCIPAQVQHNINLTVICWQVEMFKKMYLSSWLKEDLIL